MIMIDFIWWALKHIGVKNLYILPTCTYNRGFDGRFCQWKYQNLWEFSKELSVFAGNISYSVMQVKTKKNEEDMRKIWWGFAAKVRKLRVSNQEEKEQEPNIH